MISNKFTFNIGLRWTLQETGPHDSLGNLIIIKLALSIRSPFVFASWKDLTQPHLRPVLATSCHDLFNL